MNAAQLQAYLEQHKQVVLGVGAAGVVGLALLKRKKGATATGTAAATSRPAGTIPAAAVASQPTASTYDSSAYDVYNALSGQLSQLAEQQQQTVGGSTSTAPAPIASTLFAPTGTGRFVKYGNGTVAEVETDGSLYGIAPNESFDRSLYDPSKVISLPWANQMEGGPAYGDLVHNLAAAGGKPISG